VPREAVKIRSQSAVEEEDGFIEENCLVDCASPLIYDTYTDEEVSFIYQVLDESPKRDAILSKTFTQSCDEIYEAEMTFLSKSEGVFVSTLRILMVCAKGKAREKHGKSTRQGEVWGLQHNRRSRLMIRAITYIMGCGLVVILRRGEWNKLTGHSKNRGKNRPNLRTNSLQSWENDVDQET
jgi:hypothetical protein